jgi:hypothetical protein
VPDSRRDSRRWSWFRAARVSRAAQQESGSRAGELLIPLLDEAGGRAEVDTLLARGKYIDALRRVREPTGLSLADALRLADTLEWKSGRRLRPPGVLLSPVRLAAEKELGLHRWRRWLPWLGIGLAVNGVMGFIPALRGWPEAIIGGILLLFLLALFVDLAIVYRRQLKAARGRAQGRG